jgi:cellulose synthase/poly-beta-1,6-N-acetylglucosamine synthase-like glycosyltransferase
MPAPMSTPMPVAELEAMVRRGLDAQPRSIAEDTAYGTSYAVVLAHRTGLPFVDLRAEDVDCDLIQRIGARRCLAEGLLPLRNIGEAVLVAICDPQALLRNAGLLIEQFGRVLPVIAPAEAIELTLDKYLGAQLARLSETSVPADESCRGWGGPRRLQRAILLAGLVGALMVVAADTLALVILIWTLLCSAAAIVLRFAAVTASLRHPLPPPAPAANTHLPSVSVIVALYRESRITARLIGRLCEIDYPRDRLEVIFAVEDDDEMTKTAIIESQLPSWIRMINVPPGFPRTKPRALNYALMHSHGTILGVYDAEDAPEPNQIRRIVARFMECDQRLGCIQGILDYYNPYSNWMARCFTIEYATWFRLILPGIARLRLPVPLGGTTQFFRREVLEAVGAWDAHNVTEDADLGIRLIRHGYRTELIEAATLEEANCRPIPWIKQRSRWIKGHMMTWLIHMRQPGKLLQDLGFTGFLGFQILFLGAFSQVVFAPVLWSFWLLTLGIPHPLLPSLSPTATALMIILFIMAELFNITIGILAIRRTRHRLSPFWVPTMYFYHLLATLAAWKALLELATRPFWWDKTSHGIFDNP